MVVAYLTYYIYIFLRSAARITCTVTEVTPMASAVGQSYPFPLLENSELPPVIQIPDLLRSDCARPPSSQCPLAASTFASDFHCTKAI